MVDAPCYNQIRMIIGARPNANAFNPRREGVKGLANIKSAMKRAKIANAKNLRNRMVRSSTKTALKRFDIAIAAKDQATAQDLYAKTVSKVDKAVTKGVLHRNAANRKKAQLAKRLASIQGA